MKKGILLAILICMIKVANAQNFFGTMDRTTLEAYLSRSITMAGLCDEPMPQYMDEMNMLSNINARFIGRSAGLWGAEWVVNSGYFSRVGQMVNDINNNYAAHGLIAPVIQAAIFEIVTTDVNSIRISPEVANVFGISVRNFQYDLMLYQNDSKLVNNWGNGASVPDMSRQETQMWFYFLATQYIDRGIEALHLGQVELMDHNDPNHTAWWNLLTRIRNYASSRNRHLILLDAHTHGLYLGGTNQLLFDFHSNPSRTHGTGASTSPYGGQCVIDVNGCGTIYNDSKGGLTYFGWYAVSLPFLVELDNYGFPGPANTNSGCWNAWGWDEITWFSQRALVERNEWLKYAYYKVPCLDINGHFEMPGLRGTTPSATTSSTYRAATGYFFQETMIKDIWNGVYANADWVHHNFTNEQVFNQPSPPEVKSSLIFVGNDKMYYIANDGYIHGYIYTNGDWFTVSPTYATSPSVPVSQQVKAAGCLVANPSGGTLLYLGVDGYIHGYNITNVWTYQYFDMMIPQMQSEHITAASNLIFPDDDRIYYIANDQWVHGFNRANGASPWQSVSPTYSAAFFHGQPTSSQVRAQNSLTWDATTSRLYYSGTNGLLYYLDNTGLAYWDFIYYSCPVNSQLISQNISIASNLAKSGNKFFYIGKNNGTTTPVEYRIHAVVDNGSSWNTVSPSYSAALYNSQPISSQIIAEPIPGITVMNNGADVIAFFGIDNRVHYFVDINSGWNFSYNTMHTPPSGASSGDVNSIQFTDPGHLFYVTPTNWSCDGKVHEFIFQEDNCFNTAIGNVDPKKPQYMQTTSNDVKNENNIIWPSIPSPRITSLTDIEGTAKNINIYPVPAHNILNVEFNGSYSNQMYNYKIYNEVGIKVDDNKIFDYPVQRLDISKFATGVYMIILFDAHQNTIAIKKFMVN